MEYLLVLVHAEYWFESVSSPHLSVLDQLGSALLTSTNSTLLGIAQSEQLFKIKTAFHFQSHSVCLKKVEANKSWKHLKVELQKWHLYCVVQARVIRKWKCHGQTGTNHVSCSVSVPSLSLSKNPEMAKQNQQNTPCSFAAFCLKREDPINCHAIRVDFSTRF